MRTIINELGNTIDIEVSPRIVSGVAGVLIRLVGPTSESENFITHLEAQELSAELKRVLGEKGE